jgi:hypothetical protein
MDWGGGRRIYPLDKLAFQFSNIFVQSRYRKKYVLGIQKPFFF